MNRIVPWRKSLRYVGIFLVIIFGLSLFWDGFHNPIGGEICAGIGLIAFAGVMAYLKRLEQTAEVNLNQRIRAEFPAESQMQVFKIYEHLKTKDREGLFPKILDEAHGDLNQVKKFAGLAENMKWNDFLENHF